MGFIMKKPLTFRGEHLICLFHVAFISLDLFNIVNRYCKVCKFKSTYYVPSGYAIYPMCINNKKTQQVVILLELGGGTSGISVFYNGNMVKSDGIIYGGIN